MFHDADAHRAAFGRRKRCRATPRHLLTVLCPSLQEPLRVTVHYRDLAGSYGGLARDSLLASSGSAGRWGAASHHPGQVTGSLNGAAGRPRRVRFDLPSSGGGGGDEGGGGGGGGGPQHDHNQQQQQREHRSNSNSGGWSPWAARQHQSASTRQPAQTQSQQQQQQQHAQQQQRQQRSPWSGASAGSPAGSPGSPAAMAVARPSAHLQHGLHGLHGGGLLGHHQGSSSSAVLAAARDGDHHALLELLRRNPPPSTLNHRDPQGRTAASHLAALGGAGAGAGMLELLLQCPGVDVNQPDSEGNTPLHFAAQAGQLEALNVLLRQPEVQVDARNAQGFTPLMKAALQGRTKCARALLQAGASPTLRDTGRGLRAEQWARFCGRHVCAELIERLARQRLLDRGTAYGRWGSEPELQVALGRVQQARAAAAAQQQQQQPASSSHSRSIKSRVRRAFRSGTASDLPLAPAGGASHGASPAGLPPGGAAFSLVTQLTGAGLCASTPALPVPAMPPVVKSLLRPLSVPRLQVSRVVAHPKGFFTRGF
ncbi:Ankyrin repeat domain-containing protein 33B [Frankliniella fusca]|uniref:Ankyrin repeat domain-containing protein 33B n=1 Tax=Frankliniella fusca TaxID=407009 RepID=A0AAE1HXE2_9NEOP|nr:Ankyrin repeat domain-containing protein 33B [Frankliniella fusca]